MSRKFVCQIITRFSILKSGYVPFVKTEKMFGYEVKYEHVLATRDFVHPFSGKLFHQATSYIVCIGKIFKFFWHLA